MKIFASYGITSDIGDNLPEKYRFMAREIPGHDASYCLYDTEKNEFYLDELGKTWQSKRFTATIINKHHPILKNAEGSRDKSRHRSHELLTIPSFLESLNFTDAFDHVVNGQKREGVKVKLMGYSPDLRLFFHNYNHNRKRNPPENFIGPTHHTSHAYSAFIQCPFKGKVACLSYDGGSHDGKFTWGHFDEEGNYYIRRKSHKAGLIYYLHHGMTDWWRLTDLVSIGISGDEVAGKLMGLSSYGEFDEPFYKALLKLYHTSWDPSLYLSWDDSPYDELIHEKHRLEMQIDAGGWLSDAVRYDPILGPWKALSHTLQSEYDSLHPDNARRKSIISKGNEIITHFAHNGQLAFEQFVIDFLQTDEMKKLLDDCNGQLLITGGCALNVLVNQRIRDELGIDVWVPPHCDDSGHSIGIMAHHLYTNKIVDPSYRYDFTFRNRPLTNSEEEIQHHIKKRFKRITIPDMVDHITNGKIIGFISGGAEIGPRALGHRSILCDPSYPNMKEILNDKVKHREWYRPFAPICRKEDVTEYFDGLSHNFGDMSYMSFAVKTKKKYHKTLAAITHVDGTARVQTVEKGNPDTKIIYDILSAMPEHKVLVNTSFNSNLEEIPTNDGKSVKKISEPIINSLNQAFTALRWTEMDYVVLHHDGELWLTSRDMF